MAAHCTNNPTDPRGNAYALKSLGSKPPTQVNVAIVRHLQHRHQKEASDGNTNLKGINATLRKDLIVDATGANFIAKADLYGDLFNFETKQGLSFKAE
ncbi:hypothetical protein Q4602_12195 [Paraglaciecola chathamensis]|uniref:hypothetical protein n=1 Tax=Paraglaciecola chathamensis TaxID=368405 RepID=UPI0027074F6D|nr:hypothetical protein [Paraglaciecola chathamensis]MDO6840235.1 hypothetical protein [Paraglaciecola chathamensis]